ncbi:23S rRNA (uracil(1939)-C(5))-methyltransferase RlmD [bacterium]|nr:23S rRNA (uracil(1939)-C(5))-methyltransferase RlmD [bacterium]
MTVEAPISMIAVGEELELDIYALAYGGEGIARYKGLIIFVANAFPGDRVRIRVQQVKKRFGRGELLEICHQSKERVAPICQQAEECGGCSWQQLDYPAQLQAKLSFVENAFQHIAHLKQVRVQPVVKSSPHLGYRHKIQVPIQQTAEGIRAGFFQRQTHEVIDVDTCPVQPAVGNHLFRLVRERMTVYGFSGYDEKQQAGQIRHLIIRVGLHTREVMVILVTRCKDIPRLDAFAQDLQKTIPEIVGVVQNINERSTNVILGEDFRVLTGRNFYYEEISGIRYRISAGSFFQINPFQMPHMAEAVLRAAAINANDTVVDLYCGVGFLSLECARHARRVFGIESVPGAIEDAQANKHLNHFSNVEFLAEDAGCGMKLLAEKGLHPDLVVLDPPRKGCADALLEKILEVKPEKIVYVSCNPITLARDAARLTSGGYRIRQVQPIDLFPHTYHIESVVGFIRKK